jgi:hypothetical protein
MRLPWLGYPRSSSPACPRSREQASCGLCRTYWSTPLSWVRPSAHRICRVALTLTPARERRHGSLQRGHSLHHPLRRAAGRARGGLLALHGAPPLLGQHAGECRRRDHRCRWGAHHCSALQVNGASWASFIRGLDSARPQVPPRHDAPTPGRRAARLQMKMIVEKRREIRAILNEQVGRHRTAVLPAAAVG